MDYTFPFDTCETPQKDGWIAQPYSVLINCVSLLITATFLTRTKHAYTFALILVIFLFQLFHQFSHIVHLEGKTQTYIIHALAILVNFSYLYALYCSTHIFPHAWFLVYVGAILVFDLYALCTLPFVCYFFTQILLLISSFLYYNKYMPGYFQETLPYIIGSSLVVFAVFVNEFYHCGYMLSHFPQFPFHAITEILGIVPFYLILSVFSRL